MTDAIQAIGLGKRYSLAQRQSDSLRESLTRIFRHKTAAPAQEFWALKDVSFNVKQGDRIGLVGRNGAGKSTLLKILSRITAPTTGRVGLQGRVASLLEIGTGFHSELTGRENIFLNGAILGMSRGEIQKKFDAIVDFAEVEQFLDIPVKRYSSGMYLRLAFSVAAHLDPEILIMDEVLAVGDVGFQKKCFGQMEKVGREGRTIIFVSHNMGLVTKLCTRALYLRQGKLLQDGSVDAAVSAYLREDATQKSSERLLSSDFAALRKTKSLFFRRVKIVQNNEADASEIDVRHPFDVELEYEVTVPLPNVELSIRIETQEGRPVFTTHQSDLNPDIYDARTPGLHRATIRVPEMLLMPGRYFVTLMAHQPMVQFFDVQEQAMDFNISETGTRLAKYGQYGHLGVVMLDLPWREGPIEPVV